MHHMVIRLKIELKELRSLLQRWMFLPSPRSLNNCFHFFAPIAEQIAELFVREMKMYERGSNAINKATGFHKRKKVLQVRHTLWLISLLSLTVRPRREVS